MLEPRMALKKEFSLFLTSFVDENGESVYGNRIHAMCAANKESLEVSCSHLSRFKAILAYYVSNSPSEVLKIFGMAAVSVVADIDKSFAQIKSEIHVRITDLPSVKSLPDLRQKHINTLVRVSGIVTSQTGVFPQIVYAKYDCVKCGQERSV